MNPKKPLHANISSEDYQLIQQLRERSPAQNPPKLPIKLGDRLADSVADIVGSWRFIIIQTSLLILWLFLNVTAYIQHWDPYPFILLNLMLSFQAAYTAPIIMMSQNRQADIDRQNARHDYEIDMKAELEIELLHDKFDRLEQLCTQELSNIGKAIQNQKEQLDRLEALLTEHADTSSRSGFSENPQ